MHLESGCIKEIAGGWADDDEMDFFKVAWKKYVTDISDGNWEKGMTTVPLVAYMLNDKTTHQKVRDHFGYTDSAD